MTDGPPALVQVGAVNPFPATAVASGSETVTVQTPAVQEAGVLLRAYLAAPRRSGAGNVIAIVGDYGTGKTHLAAQLLRHIREQAPVSTYTVDIEASTGTFVRLYRKFVDQLDEVDVMRRVREYYADILADDLELSELTADLSPRLRSGELDPLRVVDGLNLMDSDLLQKVHRKLEDVTRQEQFGTALTLLLRDGFARAVWEWFRGGVPDQILVDRGITEPIATDADVLEAMGVFALLYGNRGHPFVLVVDELDKLLSTSRQTAAATVDAFKKLLQVFAAADSLLILVGLPDYIDLVGANVVERIGRIVRVSALTADHVEDYIRRSQQEVNGRPTLEPFTRDTVKFLVELTDGVARRVVRLCHHLYRTAVAERSEVTEVMVREVAASAQSGLANIDTVRREVRRVLDAQGLRYVRDQPFGLDARARADYWIPLGDRDSGCAVLLTESVFGRREVDLLNQRAMLIRNAVANVEILLVVVGYLPSALSQELTEVFENEPLAYDRWTFYDSLGALLSTRARRIEESTAEDPLTVVRGRVEQMNRQQSNTQRFVEQLAVHVEDLRTSSAHQFGTIQRGLDAITRALRTAPLPAAGHQGAAPGLPPNVAALFDGVVAALAGVSRVDSVFAEALASPGRDLSVAVERRMAIRSRLGSARLFEAMGVVSLLRTLVTAFRDAVTDWYRTQAGPGPDADRAALAALCRSYDALYDLLPLFRLRDLDELEFRLEETGPFDGSVPSARVADAMAALDGFSGRVQAALLSGFKTTG